VAGEALLFPAHAGVQRDVLADRPGVVDIARVVLSFALGKAAIKPATRLLKDNLLVRLRAVCLRNEVVRAESAGGACLSSDVTQQIQVESNVASVARSKIQIALPAWSSAGGIGRRKYKPWTSIVSMVIVPCKLPGVANVDAVRSGKMDGFRD